MLGFAQVGPVPPRNDTSPTSLWSVTQDPPFLSYFNAFFVSHSRRTVLELGEPRSSLETHRSWVILTPFLSVTLGGPFLNYVNT